jgi:tetratricopeptide (TPR) repeat protein
MLTGNRPFRGDSISEVENRIRYADPDPPSKLKPEIPPELERICLKLLRKETSERYANGLEVVSDLKDWLSPKLQPPTQVVQEPTKITPRGLRSFSDEDAGFFLDLLPGVRDREGLPESVSFWKKKIHQTDPDKTFSVGMIIGPSGCGKSSLVKAGIIPRLPSSICSIYIEATTEDTEARLLSAIRRRVSGLQDCSHLVETILQMRQESPSKVVIFIDQFEQWLSSHADLRRAELVDALRQCDGRNVQAILMVRDDFWMACDRLMDTLDIRLIKAENFMTVDLFDDVHARQVLCKFGQAYGKIPEELDETSGQSKSFIESVVAGLLQDGKIVSVRLALFAEMVKDKAWVPETLQAVGGTEGVGVNFLEETFSSRSANPQHRSHQQAAKEVLRALLPTATSELKGHRRSEAELLEVSGYGARPDRFRELIRVLDDDLRLITPSDDLHQEEQGGQRGYQLTHDYLVRSLREWLTRKQRETKKGRAELRLAERAAAWGANQENKQLPTLWEWLQIRRRTEKSKWTPDERSLMRRAGGVHLRTWGTALSILVLAGSIIGYVFQQQSLKGQQEKITVAIDSLQKTLGPAVPVNISKLRDMQAPQRILPELERRYDATADAREKLSLAFGLAQFGKVDAQYIVSQIDSIEDRDTRNLVDALGQDRAGAIAELKKAASQCSGQEQYQRKARLALAALGIGDTELPIDACEFEDRADHGIRTHFIDQFPRWELDRLSLIETVKNSSSPALRSATALGLGQIPVTQISKNEKDSIGELANAWYLLPDSSTHSAVAWLMRKWKLPEPQVADATKMVDGRDWFLNSQGATFIRVTPGQVVFESIPDPREQIRQVLAEMEDGLMETGNSGEKIEAIYEYYYQRARYRFSLGRYELALSDVDLILELKIDNSLKSIIANVKRLRLLSLAKLKRTEEAETALTDWLAGQPNPVDLDYTESLFALWLGRKEQAIKRLNLGLARIQDSKGSDSNDLYYLACALAQFAEDSSASDEEKTAWVEQCLNLLDKWSIVKYRHLQKQLYEDTDLFGMHGNPRFVKLVKESIGIPQGPYWLSNREVTRGEFEAFINDEGYQGTKLVDRRESELFFYKEVSPTVWHPVQNVSWFDAIMYCNWLSTKEGRKPAYHNSGKIKLTDSDDKEFVEVNWVLDEESDGYRLPVELEWEYACRAGCSTSWSTGSELGMLESYCRMYPFKLTALCGEMLPNAWGFHDMHGNVTELCYHRLDDSPFVYCRGGSWLHVAEKCWCWFRESYPPQVRQRHIGFRVALSSSGIPQSPEADK